MFFSFVLISIVVGFFTIGEKYDFGGENLKVLFFLVTLEASSCREEGSLYIVPEVLTSVGPFGLNSVI